MQMHIRVDSVKLRGTHDDKRGNRLVNATVAFDINSDLGQIQIAVTVDDCQGFDWAVHDAKGILAKWAGYLSDAARAL